MKLNKYFKLIEKHMYYIMVARFNYTLLVIQVTS